jgi:CheY-like chemotaxis protein
VLGERITLETVLATDLPPVEASQAEIEQALISLATNGGEAMPTGGTLTIGTAIEELDEAGVSAHPQARPGPYVQLSVTDTGCGMAPETAKRVFEPFFSTKPVGRGAGLGLSTVFADVTRAGGFIEFESCLGDGTVFCVYLPAAEQRKLATSDGTNRPAAGFQSGGETILVCDDDPVVLASSKVLLESKGFSVIPACGGHEALAAAASHPGPIELLLSDIIMPEMNGWELAEKLAQQRPKMKVVFMSGYPEDVLEAAAPEGQRIEFIEKPPVGNVLFQRIREVLDQATRSLL